MSGGYLCLAAFQYGGHLHTVATCGVGHGKPRRDVGDAIPYASHSERSEESHPHPTITFVIPIAVRLRNLCSVITCKAIILFWLLQQRSLTAFRDDTLFLQYSCHSEQAVPVKNLICCDLYSDKT